MGRFDGLFWALNAAQTLAAPLLLGKKWRRFRARGDAYEWDLARWKCDFPAPALDGTPHLILVAMGFAETRLANQLAAQLQAQMPGLRVSIAIRNRAAAEQGGAISPRQTVLPLPFDYFYPVEKWIARAAPDAVVFIERFQFPVFARALHGRGVKVAAVAARSRRHRGGRYAFGAFYARWFLESFDLLCFRSDEERKNLGVLPVSTAACVTGSLKFWPQLPAIEPRRARELEHWLELAGRRPVLAAGSTQPGDEAWIFHAFAPLRDKFGAVLLLTPRHAERAGEVEALALARGWNCARRSRFAPGAGENRAPDVLLLDTLGELAHAYGKARAAFVGGTLSGTGHNVLEPLCHGIPVFYGPKRGTFGAEQQGCEASGVGFRVATPDELRSGWERAIVDVNWRREIEEKAREFNRQGARAWDLTVDALRFWLDGERGGERDGEEQAR